MTKIFSRLCIVLSVCCLCLLIVPTALLCGAERWDVKVARDKHIKYFFKNQDIDSGEIINAIPVTIAKLLQEPWPFAQYKKSPKWSYYQRAAAAEYRIWEVTARFIKKKNEDDEDYHLILKSGQKTLVAEIPSPNCLDETPEPFKTLITQARSEFDDWFANQSGSTFNQKVRVTGLGMFDALAHAEGTAPNGIELHPVIKIEFLD
jgi:hypothetical protein